MWEAPFDGGSTVIGESVVNRRSFGHNVTKLPVLVVIPDVSKIDTQKHHHFKLRLAVRSR